MNRRGVITTACSFVSIAVAGCLSDRDEIGTGGSTASEITHWAADTTPHRRDGFPARDEPPRIDVNGESTVVVEGYFMYPSGNCEELVISRDRTAYDPEEGSLTVWVGYVRDQDPEEDCTVPESTVSYRIEIGFADGLPDRVTAVEYGSDGEKEATRPEG